ncbi:AAA family ATPase [Pelotomaculum isophthalicicum JI]|uniref:AAA family ATPase n=1 Tax=Pelotomaculum isophthalicicum JI TaxID=947010 RepID=A0A9X4GYY1_9FIRM|nr:AAA family ATPase [Pelotomaculum isophthalicicum]MDF9408197.1 AAA family ATPase [Pelotomaculum isophthalicicum JI]
MKINRLYLQNFRSHRESDISLDRVNFFLGKNNAGKTSLLAALEWGLTGRCYWTDKAGRGAGDLIKTGAKSATVLADLAGAGLAVRTMNPNGFTFDGETAAQAAQAKLYAALQTNEGDLQAALNVSAFLAMSPSEQKTYLFNVLDLRWDIDIVLAALREWANRSGHGEKIERLEHLVRPLYPPKVQAGPEVLDAIEKKLRDLRRDTKRDLQRIRAAQEENPVSNPAPDVTLEEVLAQLAELRAERDNILTMLADRKRSEDRRKTLQANYEAVRGRLSQITDALAGLAGQAPVKPFAVPDRAVLDGAAALVAKRQAGVVSLEAEWRTLKAALDALSKAGSRCPLAPDHITCAMTTAKRIKLLEDLAAQADAKAAAVEQARLELDQARRENERQKTFAEQARQAERAAQEANAKKPGCRPRLANCPGRLTTWPRSCKNTKPCRPRIYHL